MAAWKLRNQSSGKQQELKKEILQFRKRSFWLFFHCVLFHMFKSISIKQKLCVVTTHFVLCLCFALHPSMYIFFIKRGAGGIILLHLSVRCLYDFALRKSTDVRSCLWVQLPFIFLYVLSLGSWFITKHNPSKSHQSHIVLIHCTDLLKTIPETRKYFYE